MILHLTAKEVEDLLNISQGRLERVAIPGSWRAYKVKDAVVIEIFEKATPQ